MKAAAEHLSSVTLELGGSNPVVVGKSANLKDAAEKITWGKLFNAGQVCLSPNHILVHDSVADDFIAELKVAFGSFEGEENYCKIIHQEHGERLQNLLNEGMKQGAQQIKMGSWNASSQRFEPTIVELSQADNPLVKEEIFGPILPLIRFGELKTVVDHILVNPRPLCLYVFSKNRKEIKTLTKLESPGNVAINGVVLNAVHPHLPFGGNNFSGIGKAHGYFGFMEFTHQKSVLRQRIGFTTAKIFHPPYTPLKEKLARFVTRWL
jgi:aldehyde dehydrogenase (NAD+)